MSSSKTNHMRREKRLQWVSKGSWISERAITWGDGMSDLYALVPDPQSQWHRNAR